MLVKAFHVSKFSGLQYAIIVFEKSAYTAAPAFDDQRF
jgi:hypothetical protein